VSPTFPIPPICPRIIWKCRMPRVFPTCRPHRSSAPSSVIPLIKRGRARRRGRGPAGPRLLKSRIGPKVGVEGFSCPVRCMGRCLLSLGLSLNWGSVFRVRFVSFWASRIRNPQLLTYLSGSFHQKAKKLVTLILPVL
jgi:hypothetical protein